MTDPSTDGSDTGPAICSAKGCQLPAAWELRWNNPKLHTPERRKVWLACEEHRTSLTDFLGARGFLRETVAHAG
ncbi:acetone carboxylase [Nocardioides sp.]|uniref:acetone carboxylase n=1 Tax=Nocardioides sp. TaxID=35761 RepID=UPI003513CCDC